MPQREVRTWQLGTEAGLPGGQRDPPGHEVASRAVPPRDDYDETVAESFPASDPPPGVIKLGPRQARRPGPPARKQPG
jgi:hypothetical protein